MGVKYNKLNMFEKMWDVNIIYIYGVYVRLNVMRKMLNGKDGNSYENNFIYNLFHNYYNISFIFFKKVLKNIKGYIIINYEINYGLNYINLFLVDDCKYIINRFSFVKNYSYFIRKIRLNGFVTNIKGLEVIFKKSCYNYNNLNLNYYNYVNSFKKDEIKEENLVKRGVLGLLFPRFFKVISYISYLLKRAEKYINKFLYKNIKK